MQQYRDKRLYYAERLETEGRVIIVDMPITLEIEERLCSLPNMTLLFVSYLAKMLVSLMEEANSGSDSQLLVFPGNGGLAVRDLWPVSDDRTSNVVAKRIWSPGLDPVAVVGQIHDPRFLIMDETIIVLDDVISSGSTLRTLHERNSWRTPRAKWLAGTWISQAPRRGYPLNLYESVYAAVLTESSKGQRVPINSLSTFVENDEIMFDYAFRSGYTGRFREIIRDLR